MDIKQQFKEKPLITIATIIGILTSLTGLVTGVTVAIQKVSALSEKIVFKVDLDESEKTIIAEIQKSAVITRLVIVGELEERKDELLEELEDAEDAGKIAVLLEEIKILDKRLDRIKGIDE